MSRSEGLKSKAQALPEDVQAALALESLEILSTLRSQHVRKEEICQIIQKSQEWMETAVASFAKQGARSILVVIYDSDGTNEKSEGFTRLAESDKLDNLDVPDVFTRVQLVRVVRNLGNENPDIVVNCLDLEATCRRWTAPWLRTRPCARRWKLQIREEVLIQITLRLALF